MDHDSWSIIIHDEDRLFKFINYIVILKVVILKVIIFNHM